MRQLTDKQRQLAMKLFSWSLAVFVVIAAVAVWIQERLDTDVSLDAYDLFPLFGLLAFSLMWTHYVTGTIRRFLKMHPSTLRLFFKSTSWAVLILLLLHPSLFVAQLWIDGFGVPPLSYLSVYTGTTEQFALALGTLALLCFLAFELHRKFRKTSWWKYVRYANLFAMTAIFYHALELGGELDHLWYRVLWILYGITFALVVGTDLFNKRRKA